MLGLNHPQTPYVFAASCQLDLILDYSKRITMSGTPQRRFMFKVVLPAFAALRWLAERHFTNDPKIFDGIAELECQVEALVELPLQRPGYLGGPEPLCPSCAGTLTTPNKYDPIPYCSSCLQVISSGLDRVRSLEEGFGTEAI